MKTIAQLQAAINDKQQHLRWLQNQHDFVMNSTIREKYAGKIAETARKLECLREEFEARTALETDCEEV
jgi:hypothetical protein